MLLSAAPRWRLAAVLLLAAWTSGANAQDTSRNPIKIEHAWVRAATVTVSAAYMRIATRSSAGDRLLGVSSAIAERAELHEVSMDGSIMRMRPVESIAVTPAAPAELRPGGLHIMLIGLGQPLKAGDKVKLALRFERAGAVEIEVPVRAGPP